MYRAVPPIQERADELKHLLAAERHPQPRQRLHALSLLTRGQATTRTDRARWCGVYRETVGHWLDRYAQGGLPLLLDIYIPQDKPSQLPPAVLTHLAQRLCQPHGVGSYDELRCWLQQEHGITIKYTTLANFLHRKYHTRPNVARPSHIKTP